MCYLRDSLGEQPCAKDPGSQLCLLQGSRWVRWRVAGERSTTPPSWGLGEVGRELREGAGEVWDAGQRHFEGGEEAEEEGVLGWRGGESDGGRGAEDI